MRSKEGHVIEKSSGIIENCQRLCLQTDDDLTTDTPAAWMTPTLGNKSMTQNQEKTKTKQFDTKHIISQSD